MWWPLLPRKPSGVYKVRIRPVSLLLLKSYLSKLVNPVCAVLYDCTDCCIKIINVCCRVINTGDGRIVQLFEGTVMVLLTDTDLQPVIQWQIKCMCPQQTDQYSWQRCDCMWCRLRYWDWWWFHLPPGRHWVNSLHWYYLAWLHHPGFDAHSYRYIIAQCSGSKQSPGCSRRKCTSVFISLSETESLYRYHCWVVLIQQYLFGRAVAYTDQWSYRNPVKGIFIQVADSISKCWVGKRSDSNHLSSCSIITS